LLGQKLKSVMKYILDFKKLCSGYRNMIYHLGLKN